MNSKKLKNVSPLELSDAYSKISRYFFAFPQSAVGLNDLAAAVNSSKTTVKIAVLHLVKEGFLKKEEVGKTWRIYCNSKDPYMITRKIPYNLQLVYDSGIISAVYERVSNAKAIVLFGSYRWGVDAEKSDIDIAVEVIGNHDMQIEQLGIIKQLGFRKDVPVNMHIFSRNKVDLNLFANIVNGIVLDGFLEVGI